MRECVIDEYQDKETRFVFDQMDEGTSFVRRLLQKEVWLCVDDACVKWKWLKFGTLDGSWSRVGEMLIHK